MLPFLLPFILHVLASWTNAPTPPFGRFLAAEREYQNDTGTEKKINMARWRSDTGVDLKWPVGGLAASLAALSGLAASLALSGGL